MVLDRNPSNFFAGSGAVGLRHRRVGGRHRFSDDKMLQGRTLSYSDTQRYRIGPNYLQLPINAPQEKARAHSQPARRPDDLLRRRGGASPHVNYEPSSMGGLKEAPKPARTTTSGWRVISAATRPPGLRTITAGGRPLPHL
jgi:catalase